MLFFPFCLCMHQEHRRDPYLLSGTSWTETMKGSAVATFDTGGFFLALVCSADVAGRASPANTQGSPSCARAKGWDWLRQYVIWLSSPGNQSLEKDTEFVLPWRGAEPVSGSGERLLARWQTPAPPTNAVKPECALSSSSAALTYRWTWVVQRELLKPLVNKIVMITCTNRWARTVKEKLGKHGGSLIFPMVFDSACDLLARKIFEAAQ